jgi:hypothetical protein
VTLDTHTEFKRERERERERERALSSCDSRGGLSAGPDRLVGGRAREGAATPGPGRGAQGQ